jgi:hypothetical protein
VVYIVVAVALAVVAYRWNMPLTMRNAFYPLLGVALHIETRVTRYPTSMLSSPTSRPSSPMSI